MTTNQLDEQARVSWVREAFQKANQYLAENGILFDSVKVEQCLYLAPIVAVWKIKAKNGKWYWVISGNVTSDACALDNAANARDAMRHFALSWQLKAEQLLNMQQLDQTQRDYANLLIEQAERLYQMHDNESLWQPTANS